MLHVGILPNHDRWGDALHNLRYVVVDEAHVYRGVFGSHVGNVLRRLRRLARVYGSEPQFLLASATIANPGELAHALTGREATVVDIDTSARSERDVVLWNPALLDPELGVRASSLSEASLLLAGLVSRGLRTICFAKSRKAAELIHRFTSDRVDTATAARLAPYRAGYTPAQRREIERRLMEGELLGVSATDALELGIDIGELDCAISVGFPGTVASLRQQWGRAGRRGHGLAILVASEDGLDQFFMREPEALLERRVEATRLDHANPRILDPHVCAAAYEGPVRDDDAATLGPEAIERAAVLPELEHTPAGFVWKGRDTPAGRFSLRSGDQDSFAIVDATTGSVLGMAERERAYSTVHEGAVYLHLGEQYLVRALDGADPDGGRRARARRLVHAGEEGHQYGDRGDTSRRASGGRRPAVRARLGDRAGDRLPAEGDRGRLDARGRAPDPAGGDLRDRGGLVLSRTAALLEEIEEMPKLLGALHAAEHALISLLPLWAMCDRWDIGGLSTNLHFQTDLPTVFVYDGHAGGVGITERGFDCFAGWVADTARLLAGCPCSNGCPSCVQSPKCGNLNEMLDKHAAALLLERMAAG